MDTTKKIEVLTSAIPANAVKPKAPTRGGIKVKAKVRAGQIKCR